MKKLKHKNGAALITVIVVLVVVMILTLSLTTLFSSNFKQVNYQQKRIQGHYIAMSGIEMGFNALMTEDINGTMLYEKLKWDKENYNDINADLTAKITSGHFPLIDNIIIEGNTVEINISPINNGGKREIKIQSLATLKTSDNTETISLIFNTENIMERRWE